MRNFISIVETYVEEVFNYGKFDESKVDVTSLTEKLLNGSHRLKEIQENIFLYQNSSYYFLYDEEKLKLVGFVKISPITICSKDYFHIDLIYITPEYRKTTAKSALLYVIKEEMSLPVIADGVIFPDGQRLLLKLLSTPILNVKILNKTNGQVTPFTHLVNDPDLCYLLKETKIGYGKQYFPEGCAYTWYNIIDEDDENN